MKRLGFLPLLAVMFVRPAQGQVAAHVSAAEATLHLVDHVDAVYPAIAKVANVRGTVMLQVTVDASGKVKKIDSLSGNAMLLQAAMDAVRNWTWSPFAEAEGRPVQFEVSVPFGDAPAGDAQQTALDLSIAKQYYALDSTCRAALLQPDDHAVEPCREEVATAERFPFQQQRHLEILDAHENLGRALLASGSAKQAVGEFEKAVRIARKSLKKSDAEFAYTLFWLGTAESQMPDNDAALRDYTTAEESMRLAIKQLPSMTKQYQFSLKRMLQQHAALMSAMGRDKDGQKLLVEANSI